MQPTNNDIQRDLGRMEANQDAAKERAGIDKEEARDRFRGLENTVRDGFNLMSSRLDSMSADMRKLETKEGNRSTIERVAAWIVGIVAAIIGSGITLLTGHYWK